MVRWPPGPRSRARRNRTQSDVDAGVVDNTATATGEPPSGDPVTDTDGNGPDAGDTIDYTFTVTNGGNVTLNPVTVDDPKTGPVSCPATALAPGEKMTCTATYALTRSDVDTGKVDNTATATGTPPSGDPVGSSDDTSTPVGATAGLSLDKRATLVDGNGDGTAQAGEKPLAPGGTVTCTASYVVTRADDDAGSVHNIATRRPRARVVGTSARHRTTPPSQQATSPARPTRHDSAWHAPTRYHATGGPGRLRATPRGPARHGDEPGRTGRERVGGDPGRPAGSAPREVTPSPRRVVVSGRSGSFRGSCACSAS